MATTDDLARYRANWQDEVDSASLYRTIAEMEADPALAEVYRKLAASEEKHATFWAERLRAAGAVVPPPRPSWRSRTMASLARRFGASLIVPSLADAERTASRSYANQSEVKGTTMVADEASHQLTLQSIVAPGGGLKGSALAQLEGRHKATSGNALRAAVLGANDGLVSNLSLVMGVAGAALPSSTILITGVAGLLAGAASMALGEWLSVQSSRELYERQIAIERAELLESPEEEEEELALIYRSKGLPEAEAKALAARLIADPAAALDTLAREELGIEPKELGGSAWEAAGTSFVLFAIGAVIPVVPFVMLSGTQAVVASIAVSSLGLFGIGAGITLMTGRSVLFSGTRQVLFGLIAAALTFFIGRLIGVSLAG